jgi:hypothetical protein
MEAKKHPSFKEPFGKTEEPPGPDISLEFPEF